MSDHLYSVSDHSSSSRLNSFLSESGVPLLLGAGALMWRCVDFEWGEVRGEKVPLDGAETVVRRESRLRFLQSRLQASKHVAPWQSGIFHELLDF
jgi:hypothetical protein